MHAKVRTLSARCRADTILTGLGSFEANEAPKFTMNRHIPIGTDYLNLRND